MGVWVFEKTKVVEEAENFSERSILRIISNKSILPPILLSLGVTGGADARRSSGDKIERRITQSYPKTSTL